MWPTSAPIIPWAPIRAAAKLGTELKIPGLTEEWVRQSQSYFRSLIVASAIPPLWGTAFELRSGRAAQYNEQNHIVPCARQC